MNDMSMSEYDYLESLYEWENRPWYIKVGDWISRQLWNLKELIKPTRKAGIMGSKGNGKCYKS